MIKKITLLSLISTLPCSSIVYAGGMGDGNTSSCCSAFMSLEAGYTVNKIEGYNFTIDGITTTTLKSNKKNTHYSGRLAAGALSMMDEDIGFTGEVGWGYYGRTTLNPTLTGLTTPIRNISSKYTISGFDTLVGVAFIQPCYSLSFKVGALIQNLQSDDVISYVTPPTVYVLKSKNNKTAALPEVKLGAAYNIDSNWAITGSYLFALGGTTKTTGVFSTTSPSYSLNIDNQNPMLNSLLLGVQYTV
jgi:hypothetical protein